jgi:hypothetical protein
VAATAKTQPASGPAAAPIPAMSTGRYLFVLAIAFVLTWVLGYWIRQAEIVTLACQVTEAAPAIPAVVALLFLLALNPLLRLLPGLRGLRNGEITLIYVFVVIATTMFACSIVRYLIANLSGAYYFNSPENPIGQLAANLPSWLSPTSSLVHKQLYESSPSGQVPWAVWATPIATWTGLFMLMGGSLLGLMMLVSDRWIDQERLSFPLVQLPLEMMGQGTSGHFFRNKAMWIGFGTAAALNFYNATKAVFFGGPAGGLRFDIGADVREFPLAAFLPMSIHLRPELIGLGYLVSTEVSFSIWFSFFLHKLQALILVFSGMKLDNIPFTREQGMGAYFVLGVILLWKDRRVMLEAYRSVFGGQQAGSNTRYRWALVSVLVGALGVIIIWTVAGMEAWLAISYLVVLLLVAVVYARARAETGIPLLWLYPIGGQYAAFFNFLGSAPIMGYSRSLLSPTIFALNGVFSRGFFPTVAAYQIEGLRLGRQTGVDWRRIAMTCMLAIGWGTVAAFIFHLQPYYGRGAITMQGGIWGTRDAQETFKAILRYSTSPKAPDTNSIVATLFGGGFSAILAAARARWMGFPLNPIGYAVACAYGSLVWGPFLLTWLIKTVVLHYGGGRAYVATIPAFLGFALGHFITAGVIWGSLAATLGGPFQYWSIWFG